MTKDDLGARLLCANQHPDHDSIANFRKRHQVVFERLFRQSLVLCAEAGLISLGDIDLYVDGTKMLANASGSRTVTYAKVRKTESELQELVERILKEAEDQDAAEDDLYGSGKSGGADVPEDFQDPKKAAELLRKARERLERLSKARSEMENAARAEAEDAVRQAQVKRDEHEEAKKRGRRPVVPNANDLAAKLCSRKRINLTDPDSRLMQDGATKAIVQAYNCQIVTTAQSQIIVACAATSDENDVRQLAPMAQMAADNLKHLGAAANTSRRLGADAGYLSVAGVNDPRASQFDLYIAPGKEGAMTEAQAAEPIYEDETKSPETVASTSGIEWHVDEEPEPTPAALLRQQMRAKLSTDDGREFYNHRSSGVEPVFSETKEARGIRRLLLRGTEAVNAEWQLISFTHNIRKLFGHCRKKEQERTKQNKPTNPRRKCESANAKTLRLALEPG
jgi:hypothetical protein